MIRFDKLTALLIDKGMTWKDLGRGSGLSDETVYRIKEGKTVTIASIDKICNYFKLPVQDIMEWTDTGDMKAIEKNKKKRINTIREIEKLKRELEQLEREENSFKRTKTDGE